MRSGKVKTFSKEIAPHILSHVVVGVSSESCGSVHHPFG